MTNIIDHVRRMVNESCKNGDEIQKGECSVSLENAPRPYAVIDFDDENAPISRRQRRCDYLFVANGEENWTIPVELKATGLNPNKVARQLSAGARAAAKIVPGRINSKFVLVAVVKTANKQQLKDLRDPDKMIQFHGQSEYIRVIYCGDSLTEAM